MKGYLNEPEKTQQVLKEEHGIKWYCTGDKGYLDEDGFLNIVDRYSRFAKISGEMISLSLVENTILKQCNNEAELLVTAISDSKKGEKLVLLYNENTLNEEELKQAIANSELTNLQKPSQTIAVADIPKLGSGKKDFNQGNKLALEELNKQSWHIPTTQMLKLCNNIYEGRSLQPVRLIVKPFAMKTIHLIFLSIHFPFLVLTVKSI